MRVLITGATGLVGRALVPALQHLRYTIVVWTRSAARARARLGADVETLEMGCDPRMLVAETEQSDAVINLAGAPILGGRWTTARRRVLRESRVDIADRLVDAIAATAHRPRVLVSASAIGYYGNRGDELLTEHAARGSGFLAELADGWETAAARAELHGVRVVVLRSGMVLGRDGGALGRMLPLFRLGLGGPLGSGEQWVSWIHLHDLVRLVVLALDDERYAGPVNAVSPEPVKNRALVAAIGKALERPAMVPVPASVLRIALGDAAATVLESQRVDAAALRRLGFEHEFPTIDRALAELSGGAPVTVRRLAGSAQMPASPASWSYLDGRPAAFELSMTTSVGAPLDETFAFFSRAENLGLLTPAAMRFAIDGAPPTIGDNTVIAYRMRVGPLPIVWRSRILDWQPPTGFVDVQEKGPYRSWWHEHSFEAAGDATVMTDRVRYATPLGPLGRLVNRAFSEPTLRRIFQYRADVIRLRFGTSTPSPSDRVRR